MKIGIVSHNAFGSMLGRSKGHIGGVERQVSLMSKWFASRGHDVFLLTWDEGQEDLIAIEGVKIIKMCKPLEGIKGLRFFYPKWTSLVQALKKVDADIYYQSCAEYVTGQVALWCKHRGKHFIYSVASDPECDPHLPESRTNRERILYKFGLRRADQIIVQTRKQKQMLMDGFGLHSVVLPMSCPGPSERDYRPPRAPKEGSSNVIWVGRMDKVKRIESFLDVAEAFPEITFDIVGPPDGDIAYARSVFSCAESLPNVKMHGKVERERLLELYQGSSLFCCTSIYEGFPNTFLEAWSYGLPIISTVDPDGLIATHNLGIASNQVSTLADSLRKLLESPELWLKMSKNARRYYLQNHTVDQAMSRFEGVFMETLDKKRSAF